MNNNYNTNVPIYDNAGKVIAFSTQEFLPEMQEVVKEANSVLEKHNRSVRLFIKKANYDVRKRVN